MSRLAKKPTVIPAGVTVSVSNNVVRVQGPKGTLEKQLPPGVNVTVTGAEAVFTTTNSTKAGGALWGLAAALVRNMIQGVTVGFVTRLEISGIGFRAEVAGQNLNLAVGFTHPVVFPIPAGITIIVEKSLITIAGIDKELVGQSAATIRAAKPPEPYKGKGIKYSDEVVRRKAGKAVKAAA